MSKVKKKKTVAKKVIDKNEGLKVICDCGEVLTSRRLMFLNSVDAGRWECPVCGESYLFEFEITEIGEGKMPAKYREPRKKNIRVYCEKCGNVIYTSRTKYINRLFNGTYYQSNWRCQHCGMIYKIRGRFQKGVQTEIEF